MKLSKIIRVVAGAIVFIPACLLNIVACIIAAFAAMIVGDRDGTEALLDTVKMITEMPGYLAERLKS